MKPTQVLGHMLKVAAEAPVGTVPKGPPGRPGLPPQIPMLSARPTNISPALSTYIGGQQPLVTQSMMPKNVGKSLWNRPMLAIPPYTFRALATQEAPTPSAMSGIGRELLTKHGVGVVYPVKPEDASVSYPYGWLDNLLGKTRIARLPANRMVALHEATHALDPKTERSIADAEVPAMTTEMVEAIRQGYQPEANLWIEQMKKHGPQLTGRDSTDVGRISSWMKRLRGDTTLGRKYRDWMAQQDSTVAPLPKDQP